MLLRGAGSLAALLAGAQQPKSGCGVRVPGPGHPQRPGHRVGSRRTLTRCLLARGRGRRSGPRRRRCGWHGELRPAYDTVPPATRTAPRHRHQPRHRRRGLQEGTPTPRPTAAALAPPAESRGRRLPTRTQPRPRDLGLGRGLHPGHRPAPLWEGAASGDQRDPRRPRPRRHHLDPPRQHHRHPGRATRTRTGRGVRPPTTDSRARRRPAGGRALVAGTRVRTTADGDDPRRRPRRVDRAVRGRGRIGRVLGRQDPLRAPVAPARRRTRTAPHPGAVRVVPVPVRCRRRRRDPGRTPGRCDRLVRRPTSDDRRRSSYP